MPEDVLRAYQAKLEQVTLQYAPQPYVRLSAVISGPLTVRSFRAQQDVAAAQAEVDYPVCPTLE